MTPKCRKPKKIPEGAIVVGPFILEKGRGERWRLKGVRGVKFKVFRSADMAFPFRATLDLWAIWSWKYGATPVEAAKVAYRDCLSRAKGDVRLEAQGVRLAQQELERAEKVFELLRTGKPPYVDKKKPRRKR